MALPYMLGLYHTQGQYQHKGLQGRIHEGDFRTVPVTVEFSYFSEIEVSIEAESVASPIESVRTHRTFLPLGV